MQDLFYFFRLPSHSPIVSMLLRIQILVDTEAVSASAVRIMFSRLRVEDESTGLGTGREQRLQRNRMSGRKLKVREMGTKVLRGTHECAWHLGKGVQSASLLQARRRPH